MILLQKSESCPPFISTINNVDKCPRNKTEWLKAAERKQCNQINPICTDIQYHCLPDRFHGLFIEVCAAPKIIVGKKTLLKKILLNNTTINNFISLFLDSRLHLTKGLHFIQIHVCMYVCITSDDTRAIPKKIYQYKIRLIDW